MDMISELVGAVRIGHADGRLIQRSGAWGMRYPAFVGSGFHIVVRGGGWLITADGPAARLEAGHVVLTPSGAEHGLSHAPCSLSDLPLGVMGAEPPLAGTADVELVCGAYRLDHGSLGRHLTGLPDVIPMAPDHERHPEMRSLIGLLGADVSGAEPGGSASRRALLDLVLVHVLRRWLEQNRAVGGPETADPVINAVLREIHDHPQRPWTVQRLSRTAGLSRSAFTRRFTTLVGRPPMAYLTDVRLEHAGRLLRETRSPLAAIASEVGYSTEFAFATAFRRAYGISPGRFRHRAPDVSGCDVAGTPGP
ncbi:cupin domain-containing protein [Streptomyces sp. DW26H14]|uniref:cupin domain-containing protein n=1 Tax=Streptomyces sp. DW26H14 TaxID=3435395 RepID=UPI00403DC663